MAHIRYEDFADRPGYAELLDGESLLPLLTSGSERERDWAMGEYHGDRACTGTFMLRQGDWKLIRHVGFDSELYHLRDDSGEMEDLAPSQGDVVEMLEDLLHGHFDCEGIDRRAQAYDREEFVKWRQQAKKEGVYEDVMAHVYSGYDRQSIEEIRPWAAVDEGRIEAWLNE